MEALYTVYRTLNTQDGRFYIGVHKTTDPNDDYLGSGLRLTAAVKKHGRKIFIKEVLFIFHTSEEAYAKEKELVTKELIASGQVYNIAVGGVPSIDWPDGARKKTALRGEAHPMWGKPRTAEQCSQTSATLKKTWAENNERLLAGIEKGAAKRKGVPSPLKGRTQTAEANKRRAETHRNLPKMVCTCGRAISPSNFQRHVASHSA